MEENLDSEITVEDALGRIREACYFTNDYAGIDTCRIKSSTIAIVGMYNGCDLTGTGKIQYFRITIEKLTSSPTNAR